MWSTSAMSTVASPLLPSLMSSSSFLLLPATKTLVIPPSRRDFYVSVRSSPSPSPANVAAAAPIKKKRTKKRKVPYPGEDKGIAEEMRFVAMRLRDAGAKHKTRHKDEDEDEDEDEEEQENKDKDEQEQEQEDKDPGEATWEPSMEGFLKYLVDSRLVFDTVETIVDRSDDVTYAHFRGTGLERTECLSKDIEHFSNLGFHIPEPSSPGTQYANYLKEQAECSLPSFLAHFYNIYFAHFSGGRAIGEKISSKLLVGGQLEFYNCEGDVQAMLKDIRDKLNKIGEDWSREEKRRCLRETKKCFKLSGEIVRLIIL